MTRILVTGGAGFIGSHLVDQLVARENQVVVLDDLSVGSLTNLDDAARSGRLEFVRGSVTDAALVARAVKGCEIVYHLAVQCVRRSLSEPLESHAVNAGGSIIVLEEARRAKVKRFVYCSSSEVYGNASDAVLDEDTSPCAPTTVYGASKLAGELYAEAYLRTYGLPSVVVRPFNAYGPRAYQLGQRAEVLPRFVGRVLNNLPPVIFGDGGNGRDFTYVTEIAEGIRVAGETDKLVGQRVNIAFGTMLSVGEVAHHVTAALGRDDLLPEMRAARPGDVLKLHAGTSKAQQVLGYKATIGFADGLQRYLSWIADRYPDPTVLLEDSVTNWSFPDG